MIQPTPIDHLAVDWGRVRRATYVIRQAYRYEYPGPIGGLDHRDAWVARVASNLALDEIRRARWGRLLLGPAARSSVDQTEDATVRLALGAALLALSPRQRQVIALRYLADLDEGQVSRALGISVNSVKKHAGRGRAALRQQLGPRSEVSVALE